MGMISKPAVFKGPPDSRRISKVAVQAALAADL